MRDAKRVIETCIVNAWQRGDMAGFEVGMRPPK